MFKIMLIPEHGLSLSPQIKEFRTQQTARDFGTGYAQALYGRRFGRHIDVVVIDTRTNEAVEDRRIDRTE